MDRSAQGRASGTWRTAVVEEFDFRSVGNIGDVHSGNANVMRNVEVEESVTVDSAASVADNSC